MRLPPPFSSSRPEPRDNRDIYTVSRLNGESRMVLDAGFPGKIWVEGELSNVTRPSSGHLYFTLKDAAAQVRCALFKLRSGALGFTPENGMQVIAKAKISLYEPRGDFQLVVDELEEAGGGALLRAFERLKQKLTSEGLFDAAAKQPLPNHPATIGVITSPTGAAIHDILSVIKRRFPATQVVIYPTAVQGAEAPKQIAEAIQRADRRRECDVLIVTRGGGSLEDLWAFNDEGVARAIYACQLPIISAVGHEIDFTIADFVADQRAPTPSAAAELLTPDQREIAAFLRSAQSQLYNTMVATLTQQQRQVDTCRQRLLQRHPEQQLRQKSQRLDEIELRLLRAQQNRMRLQQLRVQSATNRLQRCIPTVRIQQTTTQLTQFTTRLHLALQQNLHRAQQRFAATSRALETLSPLSTLTRGYAIVTRTRDQRLITQSSDVAPGERITAQLKQGQLICIVEQRHE